MSRKNRPPLSDRVATAAEAALAAQHYLSPVDVFLGLGWLNPNTALYWQRGQIGCLEETLPNNQARVLEALELIEAWAAQRGLLPSETAYVAKTPQRQALRFSRSGNPALERRYRAHWISPALSERQRDRLVEKASSPPELVVVIPLKDDWICHRCGAGGDFLVMENPGPACLRCVGLDDLEFLGAGDALLTRRARAKSTRQAVVVRFSRTRKRYERQGVLLEPQALAAARRELGGKEGEAES
jgi:hypothetical protein